MPNVSTASLRAALYVLLCLVSVSASAFASGGMAWQFGEIANPDKGGRAEARLTYGVPQTDNVQVAGVCAAPPGVAANSASVTFGTDIGSLKEGAGVDLRFSGGGVEHTLHGTVRGVKAEVGVTGVQVDVANDDPLWKLLGEKESIDYLVPGYRAASLELKAGQGAIQRFNDRCKVFAEQGAGQPSAAADTPPGGMSEREAFDAAKELGTIEAWEAFLNNYPTGFRADLARAYVKRIASEPAGPPPAAGAPPAAAGAPPPVQPQTRAIAAPPPPPPPVVLACTGGRYVTPAGQCVCPANEPVWTGKTCLPQVAQNCGGGRYYDAGRKLCLCPAGQPYWYANRCNAQVFCPAGSAPDEQGICVQAGPGIQQVRGAPPLIPIVGGGGKGGTAAACPEREVRQPNGTCGCQIPSVRNPWGQCQHPCFNGFVQTKNGGCECPAGTVKSSNADSAFCAKPGDPKTPIATMKAPKGKCPDPAMVLTSDGQCHCGDLPRAGNRCVPQAEWKNYSCAQLGYPDTYAQRIGCRPAGQGFNQRGGDTPQLQQGGGNWQGGQGQQGGGNWQGRQGGQGQQGGGQGQQGGGQNDVVPQILQQLLGGGRP
jgi:hypothetical protein